MALSGIIFFRESSAHPLQLLNSWKPMMNGYRVRRMCLLSGLLESTQPNRYITELPAFCRPNARSMTAPCVSMSTERVESCGSMVSTASIGSRLTLFAFTVGGSKEFVTRGPLRQTKRGRLPLLEAWSSSSALWLPPSWSPHSSTHMGPFCILNGQVYSRNLKAPISDLPEDCRPDYRLVFNNHVAGMRTARTDVFLSPNKDGRLIFNLNHHDRTFRVDVLGNGEIHYVAGRRRFSWISLDGIAFFVESASQPLELAKTWTPYKGAYRVPSFRRSSNLCVLSGIVGGGPDQFIGVVPEECHPYNQLSFFTSHNTLSRCVGGSLLDDENRTPLLETLLSPEQSVGHSNLPGNSYLSHTLLHSTSLRPVHLPWLTPSDPIRSAGKPIEMASVLDIIHASLGSKQTDRLGQSDRESSKLEETRGRASERVRELDRWMMMNRLVLEMDSSSSHCASRDAHTRQATPHSLLRASKRPQQADNRTDAQKGMLSGISRERKLRSKT